MGRNYFITALRNILRRKFYSAINAFGLAVAISFCLFVYLFIRDELSFDQFHSNKDRIFRMVESHFDLDKLKQTPKDPYRHHSYTPPPLGERMLAELPEVQQMTRIGTGQAVMTVGDKVFAQEITYVDSGFFGMFSFPLVNGSAQQIFENRSDAVLSQSTALKYFGDRDPVGKTFTIKSDSLLNLKVVAVIQTPPHNSSIQFEVLVPFQLFPDYASLRDSWGYADFPTFIQISAHADPVSLKHQLDNLVSKYTTVADEAERKWDNVPPGFKVDEYDFTPLTDIHLGTRVYWMGASDPVYSWILGGIAVLILIIACINYISIALTTSAMRRVEIGIRKVGGASKGQLIRQFSIESIVLSSFSMLMACLLVVLFLPEFNEFTSKRIAIDYSTAWHGMLVLIALSVVVGLISGCYPAFVLSGMRPVSVLKGGFKSRLGTSISKPLMVIQFFLSGCFIICSIIMGHQLTYISEKDLGYDGDGVVSIEMLSGNGQDPGQMVNVIRDRLSSNPYIGGVSSASHTLGKGWPNYDFKVHGENESAYVDRVDPYYLPMLGIKIISGRNFDPAVASDSSAIIVNEALVKDIGWNDPLDEALAWEDEDPPGPPSRVIGVVKNFNFLSLEDGIGPAILSIGGPDLDPVRVLLVRLHSGHISEGLAQTKKTWTELYPDRPFNYSFVDDDVAKQYDQYQRWTKITGVSTILAIVIACLGLFGLAGINAVNRTKEVGIRKVLGAELSSIFVLMNRDYVLLALVAFALAIPVSWYTMTHWWLTDFEYHITPGWEIFAGSVAGGLLLSLLTVSYHGIKAALANPAETLKYE